MDDDEAFLYGDDAPETFTRHPSDGASVDQSAPQPMTQLNLTGTNSLPPLLPSLLHSIDQVTSPGQVPINTLISHESKSLPLQSRLTEPGHGQTTVVPSLPATVDNPHMDLNTDLDAEGIPDEKEEDNDDEEEDEQVEEEGEEQEQGLVEESDEDLDIILEGDTSHVPILTPSRTSAQPSRFETPRDSLPMSRPVEETNITTEYKSLERADMKLAEPVPVPLKPRPIPILPADPAARHGTHNNSNNHNRLSTPENFPISVTPPPQPPLDQKPPDLQVDNPVIPSGYDDKDGSALMNFDFDAIPENEKGWKRPGAHLADWFNYGFDETTWRLYVMKQKRMRKEEGWAGNPFAAFATGNIERAWEGLPPELKDVMMGVIMGNSSGPRSNNHPAQMPSSMPSMMVMNPMMQGMEMGGYGMQGMPNMMGGGNPPMNGGHNNPGLENQLHEGANRATKQDPGGASEQPGDAHPLFGDEMDAREQHHHEQQRLQDQLRHMQHMHHMGMGAGFMPGMDLAAMFGNQEHQMFMNGPSFNGMMEMPQMPHMRHMPSPMQQQIGPGPPAMNMPRPQNLNPSTSANPVNPAPILQAAPQAPPQALPQAIPQAPPQAPPQALPQAPPQALPQALPQVPPQASPQVPLQAPPQAVQAARPDSPGILIAAATSAPGNVNQVTTPSGSPRSVAMSSLASGRGRGARIGRGRGNAQASAFLAAAAARGRGRVISASNSVTPVLPVTTTSTPSPLAEAPAQISPALPVSSTPASSVPSVVEASTERPPARPVSPLPSNVPTGPRRALPSTNGAPPRGPRAGTGGYFDKDAAGARGDEGLDYGGGSGSPRDDRKPTSRRHSHKSDREKSDVKEGSRLFEKAEDPSERSRSKSRDKDVDDKESSHKSKSSRHRHRARSKSKDLEYRSSREKGEKDKEDGSSHKANKSNGGRRSRRSRRTNEGGEDKEEDRDPHETGEECDNKEKEKHNRVREKERDRDKDKERGRDKDRERETDRDRDKDKERDSREKDREKDKERDNRERDREYDDDAEGDYSAPTNPGSRKRKPKEERTSRSKRERAD